MTKAGSTSIQNYLDHTRDQLKVHGILFPSAGFSRRNPFDPERTAGHLEFVNRLRAGDVQQIDEELHKVAPRIVVLSAENLLLDRPDEDLGALAEYFRDWRITVVAILRSQSEWLRSRYVENVMSGFQCSTQTGREFVDHALSEGWLNYSAALDRVRRLLLADEIRLVNYDVCVQQRDVVEQFLEASGIPLTNPELARSMVANVREKEAALVEGKRRLNYLLRQWPKDARLEFEAGFREVARSIVDQPATPAPLAEASWTLLPEPARAELSAVNQELSRTCGLTPPLAVPVAMGSCMYQHRASPAGINELIREGLHLASEMGARVDFPARGMRNDIPPVLAATGIRRLVDLLVSARVSVHIDSLDTAFIAASFGSKLPIHVAFAGAGSADEVNAILRSKLPSEIVCLESALIAAPELFAGAMLKGREVDVVVARSTLGLDDVLQYFDCGDAGPVLVLIGCSAVMVCEIASKFALEVEVADGDCVVLVPIPDEMNTRMQ